MVIGLIIGIVIVVVVLFFIIVYNGLVRLRNDVKNSWSGIDVQLKRRNDLIPNLINTVKGYAKHEKELLEKITKERTSIMKATSPQTIAKADAGLTGALKSLFAVAENYPQLKANENFLELQKELANTEDQIAAARRIYNENVTVFNTKTEVFPNNMVANMSGFTEFQFFKAQESEKKNVQVKF